MKAVPDKKWAMINHQTAPTAYTIFQHNPKQLTLRYNFSSNVSGRASTGIGAGGTLDAEPDGICVSGS